MNNKKLLKVVFIDTETTGRDHKVNGLTQISGAIDFITYNIDTKGFEVEHKDSFNLLLKPFPEDRIEAEALEVQNVKIEDLSAPGRLSPNIAYLQLYSLLAKYISPFDKSDKAFFVAYNASFDFEFLRTFWIKNNDKYFGSFFWFPYIDLMTIMAFMNLSSRDKLANSKLSTVMESIYNETIVKDKLHDAEYDIELTRKLFYFNLSELIL